jgi:hypothetical protein
MRFPLKLDKVKIFFVGENQITLSRYVTINGHLCARFETDVDMNKIEFPQEFRGKYDARLKGKMIVYFNLDQGCVESGQFVGSGIFSADAVQYDPVNPPKDEKDVAESQKMSMILTFDGITSIRRDLAKEAFENAH